MLKALFCFDKQLFLKKVFTKGKLRDIMQLSKTKGGTQYATRNF